MAQPIDPNSQLSQPSGQAQPSVESYYQQAIAAFKAQNYAQALTYFQQLEQLLPSSPYHLKALMGQVRVYQQIGQVAQARTICDQLVHSPSAQVRQWASQVLSQLPPAADAEPTGPAQSETISAEAMAGADLSGFVPLEKPSSAAAQPTKPPPQSVLPSDRAAAPKPITAPIPPAPLPPTTSPESQQRSLFHYQQLNQSPDPAQKSQSPIAEAVDSAAQDSNQSSQPTSRQPSPGGPRPRPQASLPKRPLGLWAGQGLTAIALLWAINWTFHFALRTTDSWLRWVRWPLRLSLPGVYQSYTGWVIASLILLAVASPWLLDYALSFWHRQKPLSTRQLQAQHPEVLRLLRQVCRQQGWQLPELRLIPDAAPLCFSYGWLPRNTRIVVSQGLLDQGSDEALTALYSYELARMVNGSLPVLSAVGLLLLLLHTGYSRLAQVGDAIAQPLGQKVLGLLASAVYGLFWLLRQMVLWLSRLCSSWGDRRAVALTQHPDHLAESLLGFAEAIAIHLQQRGALHPLHTSLEVLMPVGYRQALSPGSLLERSGDATALQAALIATDSWNPYRRWLRVNASHLPLGERLFWLNQQALLRGQPGISPERQLESQPRLTKVSPTLLLLQKAPLAGLLAGGSLAMGLWFLGGIVNRLGWWRLSWFYQDPSILTGGLWLGLGLGLLLRINRLFPDSQPNASDSTTDPPDSIAALLQYPLPLPVQGQTVILRGKLWGQAGVGNWGCQDLYLNDASGIVRLANPVPLGSLQGLFQPRNHPQKWIGRRVTVTGWGRYNGGMLWVDINQIRLDSQRCFQAYGPIWATLLSLGSSLIGIAIILKGG